MKKIEEVTKEFSEKSVWACPISFKAGVEFAQRWIPVEEELPNKLITVLVKLKSSYSEKEYTTTAQYVPSRSVLAEDFCNEDWEEDMFDHDEETDTDWCPTGWFEWQTVTDTNWMLTDEVTHWRPIEYK